MFLFLGSVMIDTLGLAATGLGDVIGPSGNFVTLTDTAKWLLVAGMLLGPLEVFTVYVLLTPVFWRR